MEKAEIEKKIWERNRVLVSKINQHNNLVVDASNKEHVYRQALAIKLLEYRANGEPVTLLKDIARGDAHVAKCKLDRDISRGMLESNKLAIRATSTTISSLQSILSRDKAEMQLK